MRHAYLMVIAVAAAAVFFLMPVRVTHAAFGVSPPFVNATHLVPGSTYTQTIYLVQDNPSQDVAINANLQLGEPARSWFSLDRGFNFVIPAGTNQFPVTVTVTVPKNASLGIYNGTISFDTAPSPTGQVTIALGAQVAVNLTVGNNVYENYIVQKISFPDIYEGQDPLVDVKFENDGNVPEAFDSAVFELYDQYDSVRLAYIEKDDGFPSTPPFTIQDYQLAFPIGFYMGVGQYWGVVTFYKDNQIVASQKTVFNVLKSDWLSEAERYFEKEWVWFVIGAILLAGIVIAFVRRMRRRRAH